jgi:hypothetical protein
VKRKVLLSTLFVLGLLAALSITSVVFAGDCPPCPPPEPPCPPPEPPCPPPPCACCPRSPGFWKNHPEAWPVDVITIGGHTFTKEEAIAHLELPVKGDKSITMFKALVAAKLNVLAGCCVPTKVGDAIADADIWMEQAGHDMPVRASSDAWQCGGEDLYLLLDAYNNGYFCD